MAPMGVPWPSRGVPWPLYEEYGLQLSYYIYCRIRPTHTEPTRCLYDDQSSLLHLLTGGIDLYTSSLVTAAPWISASVRHERQARSPDTGRRMGRGWQQRWLRCHWSVRSSCSPPWHLILSTFVEHGCECDVIAIVETPIGRCDHVTYACSLASFAIVGGDL